MVSCQPRALPVNMGPPLDGLFPASRSLLTSRHAFAKNTQLRRAVGSDSPITPNNRQNNRKFGIVPSAQWGK